MGRIIDRRRVMGKKSSKEHININVKTHNTSGTLASLDVITGGGEPVNILFRDAQYPKYWTNGYIKVIYFAPWLIYAVTPCLYGGQVYQVGDLIASWKYNEIKDITIIANI